MSVMDSPVWKFIFLIIPGNQDTWPALDIQFAERLRSKYILQRLAPRPSLTKSSQRILSGNSRLVSRGVLLDMLSQPTQLIDCGVPCTSSPKDKG